MLLGTMTAVTAQTYENNIVKTRQQPLSMTRVTDGVWMADFGRDAFGQVEITVEGEVQCDSIILHLGECVRDGRIDHNPGGTRRYLRLAVAAEKGRHTYRPTIPDDKRNTKPAAAQMPAAIGQVFPFRYVEVELSSGCQVSRDMVHVSFNDAAAMFRCDDERLNRVWDLCKYSIKATTFTGLYVDGDRERIPYEADTYINQLGHYACDTDYDMARRTFRYLIQHPTWPTEWSLQMVDIAWNDYLWTGSDVLLREYREQLLARTLLALRNDSTGLISTTASDQTSEFLKSIGRKGKLKDIVDWPHGKRKTDRESREYIAGGEDDGYVYTDYNTVVNAWHYEAVSRLATMTGDKELMAASKRLAADFNRAFLDRERGIYRDGIGTDHCSLHANMFALCFHLVPKEYIKSVTDFVVSRGMACSVYGSQFLLDALFEGGNSEAALRLLTSDSKRSWLNMLREGSTITMEAWGNEFKSNQDWNHAWGAAPANILPFRLMGIRPTEPGWSRCEIRPQTAWLREADCRVPTIKGPVSMSIRRTGNCYSMSVDIPAGVKADIFLPNVYNNVYIDGKREKRFSVEGSFIRLKQPTSGRHSILLTKELRSKELWSKEFFPDGLTPIDEWFSDTTKIDVGSLGRQYVLTDCGVTADSTAIQTKEIQKVIDRCEKDGGGVVVIPQGTFLTGALFFKKGTHLHLAEGARLKGSDDIRHYPLREMHMEGLPVRYFAALINADSADGFTITGQGTIDGNARRFWDEYWIRRKWNSSCTNLEAMRPQLVYIANSNDVTVQDVSLVNSAFWTNHLYRCDRVKYLDCTIVSPTEGKTHAPSSDGIDLDDCDDVLVHGCHIAVCDDGVAMKGGRGTFVDRDSTAGPVNRVIVEDCHFGSFSNAGITLGSDAFSCHNIIMRRCTFDGANRMVYIKLRPDTPQQYDNVLVEDCSGNLRRNGITVASWSQFHTLDERPDMPVSDVHNITFRRLQVKAPGLIYAKVSHPCRLSGFTLKDIDAEVEKASLTVKGIEGAVIENITLNGEKYNGK